MSNNTNFQWRSARGTAKDPGTGEHGGEVAEFTASGTLLVGDVVYLSADNTVAKSATAADYIKFIGVVVGGESLNHFIATDAELESATQLTAALTGKRVIVQISGIARVISGAAVTAGGAVTGSAVTAGRVSNTGATAGQIIGTVLALTGGAAVNTRMLIRHR